MKYVLALLDGQPGDAAVLDGALQAVRRFDGHVDALYLRPNSREVVLASGFGFISDLTTVVQQLDRASDEASRRARQAFETWSRVNGIPPSGRDAVSGRWQEISGFALDIDELARRGRLADLIVMARPTERSDVGSLVLLETALLETGRPVLMMPEHLQSALPGRAIIAWNGSIEASRAVAHALPLLAFAERVGVFTAPDPKHPADARDLIGYLDWHGVTAESVAAGDGRAPIGEQLLSAAGGMRADLIVTGAYSRGRLRQIAFGGVTSHLIDNAPLPVLLTH